MTARITTVLPTYCRRNLLDRAVQSVLDQGGVAVVRVFDNASLDDTEQAMRCLVASDPRVIYHRHACNIGGAANFEFGLAKVDTEFFSILSDDDYLLPGFYEKALRDLDENPDAMFWAGCTLHVDEDDTVVEARVEGWARHGRFSGEEGVRSMMHSRAPTWTGIVFRRSVLECLGPPDQLAGGPSDLDFVLRAAAHWPFIVSAHPSAVFTLNAQSFSSTQPLSAFWPGWVHMMSKVPNWPVLDACAKQRIAADLEQDAKRMLFRRGIFAMIGRRRDFATEAASILRRTPGGRLRGWLLTLALDTSRIHVVHRLLACIYGRLETLVISRRNDLQKRHGHLLRPVRRTGSG